MFNPTSLLLAGTLLQRFGGYIRTAFGWLKSAGIVTIFLLIADAIETLQGKQTALQDMIDGGGVLGTIAKVVVAIARTIEFAINGFIGLFDQLFGDGGYSSEVFDKFKKDMLELFPFDVWWTNFTDFLSRLGTKIALFSKASVVSMNPFASEGDAERAWQNFNTMNTGTTATAPTTHILGSGKVDRSGGSNTTNITSPITINVANGDPITIENTIKDVMGKWAVQASASLPAYSLLKQ